jgi:hypothetical protein
MDEVIQPPRAGGRGHTPMTDEYLYTYGVVERADLELDVEGVCGATRAFTVDCGALSAVVSTVDTLEPAREEANLRAHDDVLRSVMEGDGGRAVVPMRFGMVFKNHETLENVLREGEHEIAESLESIEGCVELGVKLVADADAGADAGTAGPGSADPDWEALRADATERLSAVSVREAEGDLFSDRLVLNRSYLVEQDDREAFNAAVDAIVDAHGDRLSVQYTGPWAPYNFVDVAVGRA